jgi:hypothetical protein
MPRGDGTGPDGKGPLGGRGLGGRGQNQNQGCRRGQGAENNLRGGGTRPGPNPKSGSDRGPGQKTDKSQAKA